MIGFKMWKYELGLPHPEESDGIVTIKMPAGSRIKKFGCQGIMLVVWAEVPLDNETEESHTLKLTYTGVDVKTNEKYTASRYIGTLTLAAGLVIHLHELF